MSGLAGMSVEKCNGGETGGNHCILAKTHIIANMLLTLFDFVALIVLNNVVENSVIVVFVVMVSVNRLTGNRRIS